MQSTISVDLGALRRNAQRLKTLVAPAKFAAVVKANGYGHGIVEVTRGLAGIADSICVYSIAEAVALRDAGIDDDLLVLGPIAPADLPTAYDCRVAITMWDTGAYAREAASIAARASDPLAIHVKVNTGVTRLGLEPGAAAAAITTYLATPEFKVAGVYTHLAAAEELDGLFTDAQISRLHHALEPVEAPLAERAVRWHAAASAAAMMWPQTRLHMVRAGLAIYGLWPSPETRKVMGDRIVLEPALRWTSHVVEVREVAAGVSVGYGRTYRSDVPTRIGVVPIGYYDGVPRAVSNTGAVLVRGARRPIAGRVCMNMFMIDLGPDPAVQPGDRVTLIGPDGSAEITLDEWAQWSGTINYELAARLPAHVARVHTA